MTNTQKMIKAAAKIQFDQMFLKGRVNDGNVEAKYPNSAFISIVTPHSEDEAHFFTQDHDNVLNLEFEDADPSMIIKWSSEAILFDRYTHGQKILDFIKKNKDKSFLIHCNAGTGRAYAIAKFIQEYFNTDLEKFEKMNPKGCQNVWILKELHLCLNEADI